jgi:hypothetical protein
VAFAFCNVKVLITNGLLSMAEEESPQDNSERRERFLFTELLRMCPGLEERILGTSEDEIELIANLVSSTLNIDTQLTRRHGINIDRKRYKGSSR